MKFARDIINGSLKYINDVQRGLKCGCCCPCCGEELIARQGDIKDWTFAHKPDSCCKLGVVGGESYIHWYMKEKFLLMKGKTLIIPRGTLECVMSESLWLTDRFQGWLKVLDLHVNDVILEKRVGNIVPDIILDTNIGKVIVEICVTHRCSDEKKALLYKLDSSEYYSILEIFVDRDKIEQFENIFKIPLESEDFDLNMFLDFNTDSISYIKDVLISDLKEYILKHSNRFKAYPCTTQKGRRTTQIYDPPCCNYKTKYAFTCRECKDLLYAVNGYLSFDYVYCGFNRRYDSDEFYNRFFE